MPDALGAIQELVGRVPDCHEEVAEVALLLGEGPGLRPGLGLGLRLRGLGLGLRGHAPGGAGRGSGWVVEGGVRRRRSEAWEGGLSE